ncbi:hypothetical protein GCM10007170_06910 [Arthrobacter liuii]|uniref:Secreted protein n=1 Tax=Arthrobacter liuii TaxID=1476996 RepID=A0ABQ2AJF3_9MICC|nr:hypothetical protein GCM10007170_06910 [Arthrobacter liuii]
MLVWGVIVTWGTFAIQPRQPIFRVGFDAVTRNCFAVGAAWHRGLAEDGPLDESAGHCIAVAVGNPPCTVLAPENLCCAKHIGAWFAIDRH